MEISFRNLKPKLILNYSDDDGYVYRFLIIACLGVIKQWIRSDFDMPCNKMARLIFRLSNTAAL